MSIVVTGSIATDQLTRLPGDFSQLLTGQQLDRVSLRFLVDDLVVRKGGSAANIAFGLGALGRRPRLVGAVGADFAEYRVWLEAHGVDCAGILVCEDSYTSRFVCTTDRSMRQMGTFYAGAMSLLDRLPVADVLDPAADLVLVGASDPAWMLALTSECRARSVEFIADVSQQLASLDGAGVRALVDGARYLMTNDYEWELLQDKTGWTARQVAERVGVRITTCGADGVRICRSGERDLFVGVVPSTGPVDATGVGDGFRAGFLTGLALQLPLERSAQLGSLIAVEVLESHGGQEWTSNRTRFARRLHDTYGRAAAAELSPALPS